jgi:hypothetical protein
MRLHSIPFVHLFLLALARGLCVAQEAPPTNELAFTLGGIPSLSRSTSQATLNLGSGIAYGVNYGRRIVSGHSIALYGEVGLLASPLRDVSSDVSSTTRNFASLYITPGVRLKFFPTSSISPYVAVGGGYADYQQSTTLLNGQPNPVSRQLARGVFDYGAGVDVRVRRWVALRGEARDFFTGAPAYNLGSISGGQHNVEISGGFVLRWH